MGKINRNKARLKRHLRVRKKIFGTSQKPRLCVFRSLKDTYVQIIDDSEGKTLVSASTVESELSNKLKGKNKSDQAALVGSLIAERAKQKKIATVVFDRGGYKYIGRVKTLAEAAREGGLKF